MSLSRAFSFMNKTGLNALKKNGEPENDRGETGPWVMNEYFLVLVLKELAGSVNVLYRSIAFSSETNSLNVTKSLPNDSPNPKNMILNCCNMSLCILDSDVLINSHPNPYFLVVLTASSKVSLNCSRFQSVNSSFLAYLWAASKNTSVFNDVFLCQVFSPRLTNPLSNRFSISDWIVSFQYLNCILCAVCSERSTTMSGFNLQVNFSKRSSIVIASCLSSNKLQMGIQNLEYRVSRFF